MTKNNIPDQEEETLIERIYKVDYTIGNHPISILMVAHSVNELTERWRQKTAPHILLTDITEVPVTEENPLPPGSVIYLADDIWPGKMVINSPLNQ